MNARLRCLLRASSSSSRRADKLAILAGDFLFAQSSWMLANLENLEVIKLISQVIADFANGEVAQAGAAAAMVQIRAELETLRGLLDEERAARAADEADGASSAEALPVRLQHAEGSRSEATAQGDEEEVEVATSEAQQPCDGLAHGRDATSVCPVRAEVSNAAPAAGVLGAASEAEHEAQLEAVRTCAAMAAQAQYDELTERATRQS